MRIKNLIYRLLVLGLLVLFFTVGCGHRALDENQFLTDNLLQAPEMDLNSTAPPVFHPIFSSENYATVLQLNDLSYAVANDFGYTQNQEFPTAETIGPIRARIATMSQQLSTQGWSAPHRIFGRTGRDNVDLDITGILNSNNSIRLIVVSFHGSRSGNKSSINHDGKGDWGSNYDFSPVSPGFVGLSDLPDSVRVHRGYANNLASARGELLKELNIHLEALGSQAPIWVWFTGHSKGAGMASLAAASFKSYLKTRNDLDLNVKVAAILFSAPQVFHGDVSQSWVHDLMERRNIFRINVHGDPVPVAASQLDSEYRSLGVLFLDNIWGVNLRTRQNYGSSAYGWLNIDELANYHYLSGARGIGLGFDPNIVMRYSNLPGGFEEGRHHLKR